MNERDPLLHEVATALRDLNAAVALWDTAQATAWPDMGKYQAQMLRASDRAETVLEKVVEREGDILPPGEKVA